MFNNHSDGEIKSEAMKVYSVYYGRGWAMPYDVVMVTVVWVLTTFFIVAIVSVIGTTYLYYDYLYLIMDMVIGFLCITVETVLVSVNRGKDSTIL